MNEFICVWFESRQAWFYQTDQQDTGGPYRTVTEAMNAALLLYGFGEADFDCVTDHGDEYRYVLAENGK